MLLPDHRAGGWLKSRNHRTDGPEVEDALQAVRAELRRRTRRWGPVLFAVLSRPRYGVFLGAVFLALGLYVRFAYLPFAAWLRRREVPASRE
jgi:hypothetical protein